MEVALCFVLVIFCVATGRQDEVECQSLPYSNSTNYTQNTTPNLPHPFPSKLFFITFLPFTIFPISSIIRQFKSPLLC